MREGKVLSYLQDALYDTQLPILPPEINSVSISWIGPDDTVSSSYPPKRLSCLEYVYKQMRVLITRI